MVDFDSGMVRKRINTRIYLRYPVNGMISDEFGKVGSKGELYPSAKLRKQLHLEPNTKVRYHVSPKGYLIVEVVYSIEDLLQESKAATVRFGEIEALSEKMQEQGEHDEK